MSGHWEDLQAVPGQGGLKIETQQPFVGGLTSIPQSHFIDGKTEAPEVAEPDLGPESSPALPHPKPRCTQGP